MNSSIKKAIQKAISSHEPVADPAFKKNPIAGDLERYDQRENAASKYYGSLMKGEREKKITYHKKGKLQCSGNLNGYDTFSLSSIWPQAAKQ